jgi:hypothetical protein
MILLKKNANNKNKIKFMNAHNAANSIKILDNSEVILQNHIEVRVINLIIDRKCERRDNKKERTLKLLKKNTSRSMEIKKL